MILSKQINPEKDLYFLGSILISEIGRKKDKSIDSIELFDSVKKIQPISFGLYSLALDWLFLIGAVELKNNELLRCF